MKIIYSYTSCEYYWQLIQIKCNLQSGIPSTITTTAIGGASPVLGGLAPQIVTSPFCQFGLERCCPVNGYTCGIRYPPISTARPPSAGQAAYGAYPWVRILKFY